MYEIPPEPSAILERGHVYLIPLLAELTLPPSIGMNLNSHYQSRSLTLSKQFLPWETR